MEITPDVLRASKSAREMLWAFDFEIETDPHASVWFDTTLLEPFEAVGRRGSGCVYALFGPQRHVLLVTSEGQAAVIAASLRDCLELVVSHPYWQDMVARSRGDLEVMRRIFRDERAAFEEDAVDDNPKIEDYRPALVAEFGLAIPEDPAARLHHAITVLGADVIVYGRDGYPCAPLFGRCPGTSRQPL
jgi:hypothetical protein